MSNMLGNLAVEMGFLALLGILYYFYQRRRILKEEGNKTPIIMGYILHSCLAERGDTAHAELDPIIESLDDYLHNRVSSPPTVLLRQYVRSGRCSAELKSVIEEGLLELE